MQLLAEWALQSIPDAFPCELTPISRSEKKLDEKTRLQVEETIDQSIFDDIFPKFIMGFLIKLEASLIRNPIINFGKISSKIL